MNIVKQNSEENILEEDILEENILEENISKLNDNNELQEQNIISYDIDKMLNLYSHDLENRPNKLKQIKNKTMLNNSLDALSGKYVKTIWSYKNYIIKKTKEIRTKRDMSWQFYRHRKKQSVGETLRTLYYKYKDSETCFVTIIYFDDPVQHKIKLTNEMIENLKILFHRRRNINCIDPFNKKPIKRLAKEKPLKDRIKLKTLWRFEIDAEANSIQETMIKLYHQNIKKIVIIYDDKIESKFEITDEIFNKLKDF
ncbi:Hypothetical protein KVN_LOCUS101 [uncultured virus]|nr:Hypothetical protein KVN_LOCUS101 [uncultured virus]